MSDNTIHIPAETLDTETDSTVEITITDPTDGSTHVFTGPDEVTVHRQIDALWGIDDANEATVHG